MQPNIAESVERPRTSEPPTPTPAATGEKVIVDANSAATAAAGGSTPQPTASSSSSSSSTPKTTSTVSKRRSTPKKSSTTTTSSSSSQQIPKASSFLSSGGDQDETVIPDPSWFSEHTRSDFVKLMASSSSSGATTPKSKRIHSPTPSSSSTPAAGRPSTGISPATSSPSSSSYHHQHPNHHSQQQSPKHQGRSVSPMQRSLDALRRRQAIRMALEEGSQDDELAPDYWNSPNEKSHVIQTSVSPTRKSQQRATTTRRPSAVDEEYEKLGDSKERKREGVASSVLQRMKAFTSVEDFGEELVISVVWSLMQQAAYACVDGLKLLVFSIYRVLYFIVFDTKLDSPASSSSSSSSSTNNNQQGNNNNNNKDRNVFGYPSPFPGIYRDAFFSTWSPHEILEPADLPMTNAFLPTPLPESAKAAAAAGGKSPAEMLRPVPAPSFWWVDLMEISGRHFIELAAQKQFSEIILQASQFERTMWLLHEDEVLRGHDLVRKVSQGESIRHNPNQQQNYFSSPSAATAAASSSASMLASVPVSALFSSPPAVNQYRHSTPNSSSSSSRLF